VAGAKRTIRELEDQRRQLLASRGTVRSSSAPPMSFGPGAVRASESLKVQVAQSEALVASLRVRVADFAQRFAKLQEAATLMPQVEAEYAQLNRDYDVNKKNYESLVTRRESATISGDMQSAGGAEFRMIDPPRVSPGPVFPNRRVLIPLALILALGAGAAAAFIAKEVRPSFFDSRAVREGTGLPVLGTVSLVETDARRSKRRRAVMRFAGATGMLVALYVVGFIALELLRDHAT
jgi:uncharacterized protein involved in exopolysaccharide biosynthesis